MEIKRYYQRPSWFRLRLYDPLIRLVIQRIGFYRFRGDTVRVLAVRGRRTGRWHHHPVGVCSSGGARHLVSFYGDSEWARNLRAGSEAKLQARKQEEPIRVAELAGDDKVSFMRFLVRRYPLIVRVWWKVNARRLTEDQLLLLVDRYPVFRITDPASA
jgi:F420H(2)-dependent quinone reductase